LGCGVLTMKPNKDRAGRYLTVDVDEGRMRPYSQQAQELKFGLEAGVVEREQIVNWADRILATHAYDDDVANISIARNVIDKEILLLLGKLIDRRDEMAAMRCVLRHGLDV